MLPRCPEEAIRPMFVLQFQPYSSPVYVNLPIALGQGGWANEDPGSVLTCLILKVLGLTRVWIAGFGQSSAEKSRTPSSRYARYE